MRPRPLETQIRRSAAARRQATAAAALLLLTAGLSCSADQPPPFCTISRATYAARYQLVSGQGACANLKGEVLGGQAYLADPDKPGDRGSVALQSEALGTRLQAGEAVTPPAVDADASHKPYAYGKFTADTPDGAHVCTVPTLDDAQLVQAAFTGPPGPMGAAGVMYPATNVKYHFSNVRSYVTAASTGVVIGGDLDYTLDGCTAKYQVVAIAPKVGCAGKDGKADQSICDTDPNLNPDVAILCEPTTLLCVPAKDFPSAKVSQ
jgi:hypothetical protein